MVTTTDPHVTLQQPVIVTGSNVKANPPILKVASEGQGKRTCGKSKRYQATKQGKEKCDQAIYI